MNARPWLLPIAGLLIAAGATLATAAVINPLPLGNWLRDPRASFILAMGGNPYPVHLIRPPEAPLSAVAQLGKEIFFDTSLSASGRQSCATCHSPAHTYGPADASAAALGGPDMASQGVRAVPSLMYLEREPNFSIGPDDDENETVSLSALAVFAATTTKAKKLAGSGSAAVNLVPQGGLFWDGRADTLQDQAIGPLLNPIEMDGGSIEAVAAKLRRAPYAALFNRFFGAATLDNPRLAVSEAVFAVARYEIEEPSFHPYTSKFDDWLEGKARFTPAEMRGYFLFNDPDRANCGGCHLDKPTADDLPPLFTDHQFEALGAPRNTSLSANRDPNYFDLGACGPWRTDISEQTQYCGMFITPTLRDVALRKVFFHNGVFHSLRQVMDFYNFRDTDPGQIYPRDTEGRVMKFDDIPPRFQANVDKEDPPFDRNPGEKPAMNAEEENDIIAFLGTLTDGYSSNAP